MHFSDKSNCDKFNNCYTKTRRAQFPQPEHETLLISIPKTIGAQELRLLMHTIGELSYLVLALYEKHYDVDALQRWLAIGKHEIAPVSNAIMNGYEIAKSLEADENLNIKIPYKLCSLSRKNNTRELQILLDQYDGHSFIKMLVYKRVDGVLKRTNEFATISFYDLGALMPALNTAYEKFDNLSA